MLVLLPQPPAPPLLLFPLLVWMKLSCTDTRLNSGWSDSPDHHCWVDSIFITLSYLLIIKTAFSIASSEERKKAFSTCISHLGAVAVFYIPLISLSFVHRFGKWAPPYVHTLIANAYLLIPPVRTPIIYSVKISNRYAELC